MVSVLLRRLPPAVGLAGLSLACSTSEVVKPRPPDMTELVESYERPSGELDPRDTAEIASAVGIVGQLLESTDILPRVRELLAGLVEPVDLAGANPNADDNGFRLRVKADGYLKATRICPGWTTPSAVDPENGSLLGTATFSERGLDPVVWGTVAACRYRVGSSRIELTPLGDDDALRVYWGEGVDLESLDTRDLVISAKLAAEIDGERARVDIDLRVLGDGALEYRVPVATGSLIVRANDDGSFLVRARDGEFACDDSFECALERSDED